MSRRLLAKPFLESRRLSTANSAAAISVFRRSEIAFKGKERHGLVPLTRRVKYQEQNVKHGLQVGEQVSIQIIGSHDVGMLASINNGAAVGMISRYEFKRMQDSLGTHSIKALVGSTHDAYVGRVSFGDVMHVRRSSPDTSLSSPLSLPLAGL